MIPKILHMIWIGPNPFPYEANFQRYVDLHPSWKIMFWTDKNLPKLKNKKIYNSIPIYATKADLLRLEVLALYGGVYVDADSFPLKPLDGMVSGIRDLFVTTNSKGRFEINCMGCPAKNAKMICLVKGFEKYWRKLGKKEDVHDCYCVYRYIRRSLKKMGCVQIERIYNCFVEEMTKETYIVQLMDHTWNDNKYFRRE